VANDPQVIEVYLGTDATQVQQQVQAQDLEQQQGPAA
jgi:hypothetical protein